MISAKQKQVSFGTGKFLQGRRIAYKRMIIVMLLLFVLIFGTAYAIRMKKIYQGEIIANVPDPEQYPVMGVDVSRYQGNIDWKTIASQNVTFAFIKATEGSSHQDITFSKNWQEVSETPIYAGAYHFFSFESSGETQAENFIQTVGELRENSLPPVIDLEFYGEYSETPLSRKETKAILDPLLKRLEEYYHVKPIIYTTIRAYCYYFLGGGYADYPLWFRNVYQEPALDWTFWQYSDQGKLEGYDGIQADQTEMCIDLNVYRRSYEDFLEEFALPERAEELLEQESEGTT